MAEFCEVPKSPAKAKIPSTGELQIRVNVHAYAFLARMTKLTYNLSKFCKLSTRSTAVERGMMTCWSEISVALNERQINRKKVKKRGITKRMRSEPRHRKISLKKQSPKGSSDDEIVGYVKKRSTRGFFKDANLLKRIRFVPHDNCGADLIADRRLHFSDHAIEKARLKVQFVI